MSTDPGFNLGTINKMMQDKFNAKPSVNPAVFEDDPTVKEAIKRLLEQQQETTEVEDIAIPEDSSNCVLCNSEDIISWASMRGNETITHNKCNGCNNLWSTE